MNARNVLQYEKFKFENGRSFAFEMFAYILVKFYYSQYDKASREAYRGIEIYSSTVRFVLKVQKFITSQDVTILKKKYS